jgi:hypothetical protein
MASQLSPGVGDVFVVRLGPTVVQITASGDYICTARVPWKGTILKIQAGVQAIGGTTDPTDVDVDVENGTTDICDLIAVVQSSAIIAGGAEDTPDSGEEVVAEGDVLHLDVDVTGGSSPTVDGVYADVYIARA